MVKHLGAVSGMILNVVRSLGKMHCYCLYALTRDVGNDPVQPLRHCRVVRAGCIRVDHHQGVQLASGTTERHRRGVCGLCINDT